MTDKEMNLEMNTEKKNMIATMIGVINGKLAAALRNSGVPALIVLSGKLNIRSFFLDFGMYNKIYTPETLDLLVGIVIGVLDDIVADDIISVIGKTFKGFGQSMIRKNQIYGLIQLYRRMFIDDGEIYYCNLNRMVYEVNIPVGQNFENDALADNVNAGLMPGIRGRKYDDGEFFDFCKQMHDDIRDELVRINMTKIPKVYLTDLTTGKFSSEVSVADLLAQDFVQKFSNIELTPVKNLPAEQDHIMQFIQEFERPFFETINHMVINVGLSESATDFMFNSCALKIMYGDEKRMNDLTLTLMIETDSEKINLEKPVCVRMDLVVGDFLSVISGKASASKNDKFGRLIKKFLEDTTYFAMTINIHDAL